MLTVEDGYSIVVYTDNVLYRLLTLDPFAGGHWYLGHEWPSPTWCLAHEVDPDCDVSYYMSLQEAGESI